MNTGQICTPAAPAGWADEIGCALRAHARLGLLVLGYVVIAYMLAAWFGDVTRIHPALYGSVLVNTWWGLLLLLSVRAGYIMVALRPRRLARAIVADWDENVRMRRRVFSAAPVLVLLSLFNSVFTSLKGMIPLMHPYDWDATLMDADRVLHFGVQPWQLLQPVLGFPVITAALNVVYNTWFIVLAGSWLWQALSGGDQRLRMQFFVSFVLCFALLGNLAATGFASGGPCYFGRLVAGPDPYAPLTAYLRGAHADVAGVWSVATQDLLWRSYSAGSVSMGVGISAMPSMHVGGATLFALLGWRAGRLLGIVMTVYAVLIMIGSVHLAWHYAVDGYAAVLGTWMIWRGVGAVIGPLDDGFGRADGGGAEAGQVYISRPKH